MPWESAEVHVKEMVMGWAVMTWMIVGELDECGVCNGPGPTEVVIEDITILL